MNEYPTTTIKEGSTGENVKILQEKLKILGYYQGSITGSFGPSTTNAIIAFQSDYNLEPSGTIDQNTWNYLYDLTASSFPNYIRQTYPTLKLNDTGEYVQLLQEQLRTLLYYNNPITGVFDDATQKAVKEFQNINKLTSDGIVGKDTWNALIYLYSPLANCSEESSPPSDSNTYTVQSGDTLYSIARKFGLTVDELKRLNNLTSNTISIGQQLIVKETNGNETPPSSNTEEYIVKRGDSLWAIANKFGTSVAEIKRLNNLTSDTLAIGQILKVPTTTTAPPPSTPDYITHTIKSGDTLYSLASRYATTVAEIKRINNLTSNALSIGQQLIIPVTPSTNHEEYIVKKGDSLWSIANKFNTTVNEIKILNNLTSNNLSIGQILLIP